MEDNSLFGLIMGVLRVVIGVYVSMLKKSLVSQGRGLFFFSDLVRKLLVVVLLPILVGVPKLSIFTLLLLVIFTGLQASITRLSVKNQVEIYSSDPSTILLLGMLIKIVINYFWVKEVPGTGGILALSLSYLVTAMLLYKDKDTTLNTTLEYTFLGVFSNLLNKTAIYFGTQGIHGFMGVCIMYLKDKPKINVSKSFVFLVIALTSITLLDMFMLIKGKDGLLLYTYIMVLEPVCVKIVCCIVSKERLYLKIPEIIMLMLTTYFVMTIV